MSPEMLKVFREDPLSATDADSYRLIWYPTFDPPTVIRISHSNGRYAITTKRLSGQGGYELGELEIERTQELSSRDWEEFDALVNRNCFWPAPSAVEELAVLDGAHRIFEANIGGDYHVVGRSLPSEQMAEIFRRLFALSPEKFEFEVYLPER